MIIASNCCQERYEMVNKCFVQLIIIVCIIIIGYSVYRVTTIGFEIYLSVIVLLLLYKYKPSFNKSFINEVSKRSYGLYLFHSPMIYITAVLCPNINPWFMLFVNYVCFGSIAYFITIALSKSKLKFIIGE